MNSHQPPRVPTWEEQTPAARARITRLTREADAQNAADREPTEAEKEAYTREVFEHELRGAHARFKASTGHGTRADATFDEWLRAEATEDPATALMAEAVTQAQDAARAAPAAADKRTTPTKVRVIVGASHAYAACTGTSWSADYQLAGGRSAHDDLRKSAAEQRAQAERHLLTAARMEAAAAMLEKQATR